MVPNSASERRLEGVASGFETGALVEQTVKLERLPVRRLEEKARKYEHQMAWLDEIALDCDELRTTLERMNTVDKIAPLSAKIDAPGISAICRGEAVPGSYPLEVVQVARRQRWYSQPWRRDPDAAERTLATGELTLTRVGDQKTLVCPLNPTRKPEDIAQDIRGAGLGIDARVVQHVDQDLLAFNQANPDLAGHAFACLQLSALLPGVAGGFVATETYTDDNDDNDDNDDSGGLRLHVDRHQAVTAQNTRVYVDHRAKEVASASAEVHDAVGGVTLRMGEQLRVPCRTVLRLEVDGRRVRGHLEDLIKAYNKVAKTLYRATLRPPTNRRIGQLGNAKTISEERAAAEQSERLGRDRRQPQDAQRPNLHQDVGLRLFFDTLTRIFDEPIAGASPFTVAAQVGIVPNREGQGGVQLKNGQRKCAADGTLALERRTLDAALMESPHGIAQLIAGDPAYGIRGFVKLLDRELASQLSVAQGLGYQRLRLREDLNMTLDQRDLKNEQVERMREQTHRKFRQLENVMANSKNQTAYLSALNNGAQPRS